jgi:hypothetical protein
MTTARTKPLAVLMLLALLTVGNLGCDDFLREASYFFDDVADTLDDIADDWDRHHDRHRDWEDVVDDLLGDIEDWFD